MKARDIVTAFAGHCEKCDVCADCRFYASGTTVGECMDAYMEQLDSGKMTLEDGFAEVRTMSKRICDICGAEILEGEINVTVETTYWFCGNVCEECLTAIESVMNSRKKGDEK